MSSDLSEMGIERSSVKREVPGSSPGVGGFNKIDFSRNGFYCSHSSVG